ncbi:esterase, partial [Pseudomonas syringae pv. tagetis]
REWLPAFRRGLACGREPVITMEDLLSLSSCLSYGFEHSPDSAFHRAGVSDWLDTVAIDQQQNLERLPRKPKLFDAGSARS